MNKTEVIEQLKDLRAHCEYQATSGETIFSDDMQALEYAINELERTAQEVPVQEQYIATIGFDDVMLKAKLERINQLKKELIQEVKSLSSAIKIQTRQDS
jgi:uncharacterized protein YqgV (UPF0045/DUF77 family)